MEKQCYRPDEVAEILNTHVKTVYKYINRVDNPLPAYKLGGKGQLRIKITDFDVWLEEHKIDPLEMNQE